MAEPESERTLISTELVRAVCKFPPARATDYRDPRVPGFVLRARPSGVHSWRVQLPNRRWISLGRLDEVTLGDARAAAQTSRAQAALGHPVAAAKSKSGRTLRKFLDETYGPWMRATFSGKRSQADRVRSVFQDFLDLDLSAITAGRVEQWRSARRRRRRNGKVVESRVSGATMNRDLAALQAVLSRAAEWGFLASKPLKGWKRSVEDESAVVRYLSKEEEERLRKALEDRDTNRRKARETANAWRRERGYQPWPVHGTYTDHLRPIVLLALNTGLRRGELLQLRWRDLDLTCSTLTVHGAGAKSGQTRHVPLNSEATSVLSAWRPADAQMGDFVFPGAKPDVALTDVKNGWTSLLKKAKVSRFRFHDTRHTFASKLVMAGVDLNTVRELLGHSDISMTLRYAHLAPEHKAAAVAKLVP